MYQRYHNDKTVFDPEAKIAFATEESAFDHGVSQDWSNVEVLGQDMSNDAFKDYEVI